MEESDFSGLGHDRTGQDITGGFDRFRSIFEADPQLNWLRHDLHFQTVKVAGNLGLGSLLGVWRQKNTCFSRAAKCFCIFWRSAAVASAKRFKRL